MRALSCDEPGKLSIIRRDEPRAAGNEVLVRIRHVGVCGTDYHIFHGNQPYLSYPRVIGHELGAEVVAAPAGSALRTGQIVSIMPTIYCGHCRACRMGKTNCCQHLEVLGVHRDGGACDYIAVPEANVIPADGLTASQAAMVEFLAIGAHGVARGGIGPGQRVAIVGAGPIGIAAAVFSKVAGAHVSVVDMNPRRLAFCADELGADAVFEASADIRDRLGQATDGDFFDCVVDATGSPGAMQKGFDLVGHGGAYVLLSLVRADIAFNDPEFHKRETTLYASRNAVRQDFETVLQAMRDGKVPLRALASHEGSLDDAPGLIPEWSRPEAGVIKAILTV
ncbi:zinc-binding alcohol dehydrogenase family protein [Labrys sp. LIt4]|uniref:Dehydrogenase n=1 Tax=Labrys okinawensis TaxID=346911 RepID=A0A2S9Q4K7_9HYPH|nr:MULTISPECIES: zinc-binding alcohol dehydrogenase family protein [Labrys]MBP0578530.1 zinc-binding alcohol dehydrogenase family protein [Labrys sp. LIt4]PRH84286.1 dehydrogenase [Labrys okinawensis]